MVKNVLYDTEHFLQKKIIRVILLVIGISIPVFFAHAEISITEIAWMGTSMSQYEEWVELYNDGTNDVALTGWKLFKTGGTVLFSPTGTIPAGTYYLICRATTSLTDPLGGACNEKGTFGGSGLNNTNDQLVLKDASGVIKESIDASGGWPAGDASSKQTMQKLNTEWITAIATPGAETVTNSEDPTPSPDTPSDLSPDPVPVSVIVKSTPDLIEKIKPDPTYKAHMIIPDFGTAGVAIPMKATVTENGNADFVSGRFEWSTGDGGSYKFLKNTSIDHVFYYPGTYQVVMQYYSNVFREEPDTIHRKTITIVPSDIQIVGYSTTDGLQLKNGATKEIALDGWIIQSNNQEFTFPKYTIIQKGSTLALSPKILGIPISKESIVLLNPTRDVVAKYSHTYTLPTNDTAALLDEPEPQPVSVEPPPNIFLEGEETKPVPESKTIHDIWNQNKWYVLFGGIVFIGILAYLAFHLYAKQDELI